MIYSHTAASYDRQRGKTATGTIAYMVNKGGNEARSTVLCLDFLLYCIFSRDEYILGRYAMVLVSIT